MAEATQMKNKVKKGSITNSVHERERIAHRKRLRLLVEQKKIAERLSVRKRNDF